ncbi:MAG TPA: glycosyltransferase family 2 protein [Terriglobales bacterium]|nr:glycosyltransferase family 2 protein [Terriglobales bacterium]
MVSVVVPIYNEELIISVLHTAVSKAMTEVGEDWEVVYVNDGSKDSSLELLCELQLEDPHVVVVDLSRNWGHMGAVSAGMRTARGEAVVLMDGDLQDPPEVIPELVAAWRNGAQVVTAVRRSREESRKYLAFLFPLFYRVLGVLSDYPIPLNAGIFGLMDRQVLDSINALREGNRYLPGLRAWVGYKTAVVYYDRHDRIGGEGKLTFQSRIKYAMDAITSFSYKPLRLSFLLGGFSLAMAVLLACVAAASQDPMNLIAFAMGASVFFVGTLVLCCMGVLAEYVGRIYDEVRARPLSVINKVYSAAEVSTPQAVSREERDLERLFPAA